MNTTAAPNDSCGRRVELGRYTTNAGVERVLIGQRVLGHVRIVDEPTSATGRKYVVEREIACHAELQAIVADYLQRAAHLGDCPMRTVLP